MLKRYAPLVVAVILGLLWLRARDGRIRAEALAEVQADSLEREIDSMATRERHRETARAAIERRDSARADSLRGLRRELRRLTAAGDSIGEHMLAYAEGDTSVSDSLLGLIQLTLGIMDRSARACNAALGTCDSIIAGKDAVIASLDSSRSEFHAAMHRSNELLTAALRRANPGLLRRIERSLPVLAAGVLVGLLLGR